MKTKTYAELRAMFEDGSSIRDSVVAFRCVLDLLERVQCIDHDDCKRDPELSMQCAFAKARAKQ